MQKSQLLFELSPWYILLCLLLGAIYAFILYQKKGPWSKRTNYILTLLRFILASFLAILILEPLIEQVKNSYAAPVYVIAVDNSLSIITNEEDSINNSKFLEQVENVKEKLTENDKEIYLRSFDQSSNLGDLSEVEYNYPITDLHGMLQSIGSDFEGRNLAGVVLLSDGIYNKGISPEYSSYGFPVYTIGLGDTIPKKDINIKTLYYNKISYQGNKFPIVAELDQNGFNKRKIKVKIEHNGNILESKDVILEDNIQEIEFLVEANEIGLQHYVISVDSLQDEFSVENNLRHAYIDIIEGKEKILLAASSPHPDIKAILNALEKNQNYEVTLYIPEIHELPASILASPDFNAIILHQIPTKTKVSVDKIINTLLEKNTPSWFILGNQSDLISFNNLNDLISIQQVTNETDQVLPHFSSNFNLFKLSESFYKAISYYPQISVPYGEFKIKGNNDLIFYQQIGNIISEKPLMIFGNNQNAKSAVLAGEGIWQWRLQEYAETGNSSGFDELISKTLQYLSAKEDKRRFKVYPIKNEFTDSEPVIFESEVYNELFEPVYNQSIQLEIINEEGKKDSYQFTTNPSNTRYRITGLREGIYKYTAQATLEGKKYSAEGEFSVEKLQLEDQNLVANHSLLRKISANSRGSFYLPAELQLLENELLKNEAKSIIYTEEQFLPLINLWWIFFFLLSIISIEWFLRKYNGSY